MRVVLASKRIGLVVGWCIVRVSLVIIVIASFLNAMLWFPYCFLCPCYFCIIFSSPDAHYLRRGYFGN